MRDPVTAFVGLGANLGDAAAALSGAADAIDRLPGTRVTQRSSLYRSAPHEAQGPDFTNAVIEVTTTLTAPELLQALQRLEQAAGRERPYRNAPRTLDLDILLYGSATMDSPHLCIPHPRMTGRAFVLLPLSEIAPQRVPQPDLLAVRGQPVTRLAQRV